MKEDQKEATELWNLRTLTRRLLKESIQMQMILSSTMKDARLPRRRKKENQFSAMRKYEKLLF